MKIEKRKETENTIGQMKTPYSPKQSDIKFIQTKSR